MVNIHLSVNQLTKLDLSIHTSLSQFGIKIFFARISRITNKASVTSLKVCVCASFLAVSQCCMNHMCELE